jgi:2-oxoglutarate dehydrogenase E2 component (dihydrolipoamide succinyltransferase)
MPEKVRIVVPELGGSITQATIRRWLKQVGDPVLAAEPLVELDTGRLTMALRAPVVGIVSETSARPGETVSIGREIGKIIPGTSDTKWTVYGSKPSWRNEFPRLSQFATWLGWKR